MRKSLVPTAAVRMRSSLASSACCCSIACSARAASYLFAALSFVASTARTSQVVDPQLIR